jgi:hypothetical protein
MDVYYLSAANKFWAERKAEMYLYRKRAYIEQWENCHNIVQNAINSSTFTRISAHCSTVRVVLNDLISH